jgi:type IV pilus secretin PilQ/predicted competence protein
MLLLLPVGETVTAQTGQAVQLSDISVTTQEDTATIFVKTSAPPKYQADLIDTPTRLVIDFEDTEYTGRKTPLALSPAPLKQLRGSQYKKGTARVVIEFTRKVGYAIREDDNGLSIVIPTGTPVAATAKPATKPDAPVTTAGRKAAAKPETGAIMAEEKPPAAELNVAEAPKVAEAPTPAEAPKIAQPAKPAEAPKVTQAPKPAEAPKPVMSTIATPAPRVKVAQAPRPSAPVTPAAPTPATPAPAAPVVQAPVNGGRLISLDFKDADVVNLLRILAAESGRNIVIGDDVRGKMSISLRNVPWTLALDTVMEARGLVKTERENVIRIVSAEQLTKEREARARVEEAKLKAEADVRTKLAEALVKEQEAQAKKFAAELAAAEAIARGPLKEETIRLSYADPEDVAKTLQGILGIPEGGMPAPGAPGGPPLIPAPPFSQLYGPEAGKAPMPPALTPNAEVLSKGITIRAHKPTNSIFIRHYANDLERIKKLIRESLDIPLPQVKIEARMEVLDRRDLFAIGVQWGGGGVLNQNSQATLVGRGFTSSFTNTPFLPGIAPTGVTPPNPNLSLGSAIPVSSATGLASGGNIVNIPIGDVLAGATGAGGLAFGIIGSRLNLDLALEALRSQAKTRTLARPEIVTVENNKAIMSLGEEIPYATVSSAGTQIQFKEAVLRLEVTPTVIREIDQNKIKMLVIVENNSRGDVVNFGASLGSPPAINKKRAETQVLIKEGERLVIGGVTNSTFVETERKIPLFGDIPFFGWLFKARATDDKTSELVVFITPSLLRTPGAPRTSSAPTAR